MTAGQFRRSTGGLRYIRSGSSGWNVYYRCTMPDGYVVGAHTVQYLAEQVRQRLERTQGTTQQTTLGAVGVNMMGVSLV